MERQRKWIGKNGTEEDEEISYYTKICAGLGDDEWEDGDWTPYSTSVKVTRELTRS